METDNYVNVPIYIEKAVRKLTKLKDQEKELVMQVMDYMETHDIPKQTPLYLLKYIPEPKVCPGQMKLDVE